MFITQRTCFQREHRICRVWPVDSRRGHVNTRAP